MTIETTVLRGDYGSDTRTLDEIAADYRDAVAECDRAWQALQAGQHELEEAMQKAHKQRDEIYRELQAAIMGGVKDSRFL